MGQVVAATTKSSIQPAHPLRLGVGCLDTICVSVIEERKMAIEYYVKRKFENGRTETVRTCETSEQAVKRASELQRLHPKRQYHCFYSDDAVDEYNRKRGVA